MIQINETLTTVLITGASGLLGRELIDQLLGKPNIFVIAVTSNKELLNMKFRKFKNLKIVESEDIFNNSILESEIDVLVNCAFPRTSDSKELMKAIAYTENLVKASIKLNVKKIINISSQSVYSQKSLAIPNETSEVAPESFYGVTKFTTERIVTLLCEGNGILFSNIRLASLSSKDLSVRMTNRFVKYALEETPICVQGGIQQLSYLHIKDAASGLLAMIQSELDTWSPIYNLGNHDFCSILELAKKVETKAFQYRKTKVEIEVDESNNNFSNLINSDEFYKSFNWKPKYTMSLIIDELFQISVK